MLVPPQAASATPLVTPKSLRRPDINRGDMQHMAEVKENCGRSLRHHECTAALLKRLLAKWTTIGDGDMCFNSRHKLIAVWGKRSFHSRQLLINPFPARACTVLYSCRLWAHTQSQVRMLRNWTGMIAALLLFWCGILCDEVARQNNFS